jgi:hypothetical protein
VEVPDTQWVKNASWILCALMALAPACWHVEPIRDDAEQGSGTGNDTDDDAGGDTGDDSDTSKNTYPPMEDCAGGAGRYDPVSDICWQEPPPSEVFVWQSALEYCEALQLGGTDGWRPPTISELRSLIRGCPPMETGGACGVTDACAGAECWNDACAGCNYLAGPGPGGCYWDASLSGLCELYWSGSSDGTSFPWYVDFGSAYLVSPYKSPYNSLRCMHPGRSD